uniref:PPM-type phosphatase domain-containing protein n=1 Tax=Rhizochromulina marina TaxID=1034831 RepID=A0A7S2R9R5_9STRA|mmetsp:Transcript_13146/g.38154  ORF Transcript_13146/g.38154 Transcript_13146/m.38154 type:complete len:463 (+) Transcript_13146:110-1498(+)|eukprot:CAMPEP_0118976132 /NCGR_PEP_ID=MMETSP1173-20130426/17882_1 /TAXON_ID=1034831 /ORGANISM="Rhizochromulina marina cf, Strain CCMP1243" /LENGTH=462 /DNA_ID=CAMNT_0006926127 /DNA_START=40 /DNA_END=1428 /DNA_ORIENTATION=+
MGAYLSEPVTEKHSEEGELYSLAFGASAMQGWRRSMEDEHIAVKLDVPPEAGGLQGQSSEVCMFAVWDGHGGHEVAKFVKNHMANELTKLNEYQQGDVEGALVKVFHRMDDMLWTDAGVEELNSYKSRPSPQGEGDARGSAGRGGADADSQSTKQMLDFFFQHLMESQGPKTGADQEGESEEEAAATGTPSSSVDDIGLPRLRAADVGRNTGLALRASTIGTEDDEEAEGKDRADGKDEEDEKGGEPTPGSKDEGKEPEDKAEADSASFPRSRTPNVCTLPNVKVTAGCTSVVSLVVGMRLYVANAGDSRAVLCRGGQALAMSEDHKPMDERELSRIEKVGGFVNPAGRVNGNLNLSRSLGDLKYKQSPVSPAEQMITAEPDVKHVDLQPDDEFMILACDGIWDCLSNQEAVDFVRSRLAEGKSPKEISEECCDHCLSEDPRKTTGIGGDNMTMMVVVFSQG